MQSSQSNDSGQNQLNPRLEIIGRTQEQTMEDTKTVKLLEQNNPETTESLEQNGTTRSMPQEEESDNADYLKSIFRTTLQKYPGMNPIKRTWLPKQKLLKYFAKILDIVNTQVLAPLLDAGSDKELHDLIYCAAYTATED